MPGIFWGCKISGSCNFWAHNMKLHQIPLPHPLPVMYTASIPLGIRAILGDPGADIVGAIHSKRSKNIRANNNFHQITKSFAPISPLFSLPIAPTNQHLGLHGCKGATGLTKH